MVADKLKRPPCFQAFPISDSMYCCEHKWEIRKRGRPGTEATVMIGLLRYGRLFAKSQESFPNENKRM